MSEAQNKSNVIDFNAARQWTLLSWMEAVSASCRKDDHEMDLEDWLAALDDEPKADSTCEAGELLGQNVINLADYRERKHTSLLRRMTAE